MRFRLFLILPTAFVLSLALAACSKSREAEWDRESKAGASEVEQGHYREAIAHYTTALEAVQTLPQDHRLTDTLSHLAEAHAAVGDLNEAEELYRRALPLERQFHGTDSPEVATTLSNLGALYLDVGRMDEAEAAYNESLVMRAKVQGADSPDYATTLMQMAALRHQLGRDTEAEELDKRALAICEKTRQQRCIATIFDNLGSLYFDKGRLEEAIDVFAKGRDAWKALAGTEHLDYAISTANLARALAQQKKYAQAEPLLKEALPIFERAYGNDGPELVGYYQGYAKLLDALNRHDEAEAFNRKAAVIAALNERQQ